MDQVMHRLSNIKRLPTKITQKHDKKFHSFISICRSKRPHMQRQMASIYYTLATVSIVQKISCHCTTNSRLACTHPHCSMCEVSYNWICTCLQAFLERKCLLDFWLFWGSSQFLIVFVNNSNWILGSFQNVVMIFKFAALFSN